MKTNSTGQSEKKELNVEVGARVNELRENASMTQEKLAEELDVSIQYISRLERGLVGMSMSTLVNMCYVFKVSADYLLLGKKKSSDIPVIIDSLRYLRPDQMEIVERSLRAALDALACDPRGNT